MKYILTFGALREEFDNLKAAQEKCWEWARDQEMVDLLSCLEEYEDEEEGEVHWGVCPYGDDGADWPVVTYRLEV